MLDVARHFFSVDEVERYVDLLALHKINRLHLHLADDQGWRIEIEKWPDLTAKGGQHGGRRHARRVLHAGAVREIVAYAADRFVTIVPEIDMPGHTNAALSSYAELNCNGTGAAAAHRHRGRLQLAVRGQGRDLPLHRRRGGGDRGDDAGARTSTPAATR